MKRLSQKSEQPFFSSPTTKAVGLNFATNSEPTALVVGVQIYRMANIWEL